MAKNKVLYRAYVTNDQGCGEFAGSGTSLNALKSHVRATYGGGWKVTIEKIEQDGDGKSEFAPVEVASFTLRY